MGPHVASAIDNARIEKDSRGLMPLKEARALVAATKVYRKGDGEMIGGTFVLESDRVWAALLSLADAGELVREATRIHWAFHVRGHGNLALVERYGDGILPWIRTRIDGRGVLHNIPWCVLPCLLAIDTREALEVALSASALDAQLVEYGTPGFFAADRHDDAAAQVPIDDPLVVARMWIDAHPARMDWLKAIGTEKAAALIADRAEPPLPEEARAILDAAPTVDEPPGPVWGIAELDTAATEYDLPLWDNANYTCGAMRLTGFASRHGDVLVVESIDYQPGASQPAERQVHVYGPGAKKRETCKSLIEDDSLEIGPNARIRGSDGVLVVWGEFDEKGKPIESHGDRLIPSPMPADYFILSLNGEDVQYDPHLQEFDVAGRLDELYRVTPEEALLFDVCRRYPEKVFLSDAGLAKLAPEGAIRLFQFRDFEWVAAGEKASRSIDLVTMVAALRERRRIDRLPGVANSRPEAWMLDSANDRFFAGGNAWAPGDEPIARPRPKAGPGKTPYQNLLFERGWPHGIQIFHGGDQERMEGVAASFQALFADPKPSPPYWGRRTAAGWVRAVANAKTLSLTDKAVQAATKDERPLHAGEARALVKKLAKTKHPAWVGGQAMLLLEALVGGDETILALADVLSGDAPVLAGAAFEIGFVLRRVPEKPHRVKGDPQRAEIRDRKKMLAALKKAKPTGETKRMLEIAIGKRDLLKEMQDGAFDSFLVTLGGDDYLRRVAPRLKKGMTDWERYQLGVLASDVAAAILEP